MSNKNDCRKLDFLVVSTGNPGINLLNGICQSKKVKKKKTSNEHIIGNEIR